MGPRTTDLAAGPIAVSWNGAATPRAPPVSTKCQQDPSGTGRHDSAPTGITALYLWAVQAIRSHGGELWFEPNLR
jgi:hypothetical protein